MQNLYLLQLVESSKESILYIILTPHCLFILLDRYVHFDQESKERGDINKLFRPCSLIRNSILFTNPCKYIAMQLIVLQTYVAR